MPNDTLEQLAKTVSSDEYDLKSGETIKKLQRQWDEVESREGLENHLVIVGFIQELKDWLVRIDETLRDMDVTDDKTKLFRFKLKADKEVVNMFMGIFDKGTRVRLEKTIRFAELKIKGDYNE